MNKFDWEKNTVWYMPSKVQTNGLTFLHSIAVYGALRIGFFGQWNPITFMI